MCQTYWNFLSLGSQMKERISSEGRVMREKHLTGK
jgi:hypothetical protein